MASEAQPLISRQNENISKESLISHSNKYVHVSKTLLLLVVLVLSAILCYAFFSLNNSSGDSVGVYSFIQMENSSPSHRVPKAWTEQSECADTKDFSITLAVKQQNIDLLAQHVDEVSNPSNTETFQQYWSSDDIKKYFSPSDESLNTIKSWLSENGFSEDNNKIEIIAEYGNLIRVHLTCGEANKLLNTKYIEYENSKTGQTHLRVENGIYSIPDTVFDHIDYISPTIRFPIRKHSLSVTAININDIDIDDDASASYVYPQKLYDLYQMSSDVLTDIIGTETADTSIRQGVGSFIDEFYDDVDLQTFWDYFNFEDQSDMERYPLTQPEGYGDEAELDTQYITTTGRDIYTVVYYIDGDGAVFAELCEAILSSTEPAPFVVSISYGGDEYELGETWVTSSNNEFGKLALAGTTILASSGDAGVLGEDEECISSDELSSSSSSSDDSDDLCYISAFPACAPYVTAVGGTVGGTIQKSVDLNTEESAWEYSGGGFSIYFDQPEWQKTAVESYLEEKADTINLNRFNSKGRAYPDISLQSTEYIICIEQGFYTVSGTSASCPSVAGMISMINYARIKSGKKSLGFLNPKLYLLYDKDNDYYFNDVTDGYNVGCEVDGGVGFYTANGWDPVTGVGTPKFSRLLEGLVNIIP